MESDVWKRLRELRSPLLADAADAMGLRCQCMSPDLRPLADGKRMAGTAVTLQTFAVVEPPKDPYIRELEFLDTLRAGDVVVAAASSTECAFWGELLTSIAQAKGAVGAVVDGWIRDADMVAESSFSVVSRGSSPYDSKGRLELAATNIPIDCGGVLVRPGDGVFADSDGIVVLPADAIAELVRRAEEKSVEEDRVRELYATGVRPVDVYRKFGVL